MSGVFIAYRKDDTRSWAITLRDHLAHTLGERHVFFDVDSLGAGQWQAQIHDALDACTVVLVLIGARWTQPSDARERNRLFRTDDVHRIEIALALARPGVTVMPVLVDGARLPTAGELPDELQGLLNHQVSEIGDPRDRRVADLRRLTRTVDVLMGHSRERRRAVAATVAIVGVGLMNTVVRSNALSVALVFLALAGCLIAWSWQIYRRMLRQQIKGAWVAALAVVLSAAMAAGSLVRLAVRTN
jgi:hypothetical protein